METATMQYTLHSPDGTTVLTVNADNRWQQLSSTLMLGPWAERPDPDADLPPFLRYNPDDDPPPIFDVPGLLWLQDDEDGDEDLASIGLEIVLVKHSDALDCLPDTIEFRT
jgi:hypothetical protein